MRWTKNVGALFTQFNSSRFFMHIFFHQEIYKTLELPNLEYPTFTQFTGFNKQSIFHDQVCNTLCSSGPY